MKSVTTERFRECYKLLPYQVKLATKKAYKKWKLNPLDNGLYFKKLHPNEIYSVRISISYRALSVKEGDTFIWFWIGNHAEYDKMIGRKV
ncbi:MAG: hypothetical protein EBZ58_07745 [Bacteroidetes bacterium]|jgi:hypothetical protein|nr:hypothetical protein [Bacteroidota bacterium]